MKNTGYILQYWMLNILGWWVNFLPEKTALNFGTHLGELTFVLGVRRKVALENLMRAFPQNNEVQNREITLSLYRNLGRNLMELLRFKKSDCQSVKNKVDLRNTEYFDQL
jgi:lauroyl/myristoyl acyltransferase